ncbi:MAG: 8-oxo-dGTP diphosphatase [Chitinispirillaceae bacterium]|nr:8-oxo-dGTP diphosphatase [Chitinispirillaceae bacterium]
MTNNIIEVRDVAFVDWKSWVPKERAVLCFVRDGNRVMLIHKKTGLGKGKVNAPGGRIEPGETPSEAAVRETFEETGVQTSELHKVGELFFIFTDGYSLHGTVFFADAHSGTPFETPEADPFWCSMGAIPYDQMWQDDIHWLPLILAGKKFKGYFIFDDDKMLSKSVVTVEEF